MMTSGKGSKKEQAKKLIASKLGRAKKVAIEDDSSRTDQLIFKVLPQEFAKDICELTDINDIESKMCEHFNIEDTSLDLKQATILDVYTASVFWAIQQKFSVEQLCAFFTIVHTLLDNVKEKGMGIVDNMREYKKMIVMCQGRPELYSVAECKALADYIDTCFMHQHRLFEFMFGISQAEEIIGADLTVEVLPLPEVPYPPPLCEGVPIEIYEDYIKTPPPTPTLDSGDEKEQVDEGEILLKSDIMTELTVEDVRDIFEEVSTKLLSNVEEDVRVRIKSKEAEFVARINKIHKVLL